MSFTPLKAPREGASVGRSSRTIGRLMAASGGFLLVATLIATGATATAAPGDEHLAGMQYVALGDSYAAGFGLTPLSTFSLTGCAQSDINYPHLVANELGLTLVDRTCSGATTDNLVATPQMVSDGTAPAQDASLGTSTKIVTVTIGGNDVGFVPIMMYCAALTASGNVLGDLAPPFAVPDCHSHFVQPAPVGDTLAAAITGPVAASLDAVLVDIKSKAPNAKIFVVGYPALTPAVAPPTPNECFATAIDFATNPATYPANSYPYKTVDVEYIHTVEALFDQTLTSVATTRGATMISLFDDTSTHSPCAAADPYVNGVTVTAFSPSPASVTLAPGALHPNAAGAAFQAAQVEAAIRAAFPAPAPSVSPSPEPSASASPSPEPSVSASPSPEPSASVSPSADPATSGASATGAGGSSLPATGFELGGWLVLASILLLFGGGMVLGAGKAVTHRQG